MKSIFWDGCLNFDQGISVVVEMGGTRLNWTFVHGGYSPKLRFVQHRCTLTHAGWEADFFFHVRGIS